jgi:hypothetical protein
MRFGIGKAPSFTHRVGTGLPHAHIAAARRRYAAMLREAADILPRLPAVGESLHALMTGLYDFMSVIGLVITSRPVPCRTLRIATLAFSSRNTHEILEHVRRGAVRDVLLVCSDFFSKHNPAIFAEARIKLGEVGGKLAAPRCHAKVCCLDFEDGVKLVFEGSANLRTNKNIEQFCLVNDPELHSWHAAWLDEQARRYEIDQVGSAATG